MRRYGWSNFARKIRGRGKKSTLKNRSRVSPRGTVAAGCTRTEAADLAGIAAREEGGDRIRRQGSSPGLGRPARRRRCGGGVGEAAGLAGPGRRAARWRRRRGPAGEAADGGRSGCRRRPAPVADGGRGRRLREPGGGVGEWAAAAESGAGTGPRARRRRRGGSAMWRAPVR